MHVRLREAKQELAAHVAKVALHTERFAESEEVVGLVVDAEERTGQSTDTAIQTDGVLALLLNLEEQVYGAGIGILMRFGILIYLEWLEIFELVEAKQAVFPELGVVDLTFVEQQFAANDAIAGDGVAFKLNA